ncbi:rhamnogalacturonan acetylesterase [Nonomuraea bangladeshensis]|uniref:rhamnogalacturonan acetylesterase n=1 Tax=Nonomuraea bangladeshensis TaxID=404385 RepID=UPI0031DDD7E3
MTVSRNLLTIATVAALTAATVLAIPPAQAAALPAGCTGTAPIVCHYDVPPGNYDLRVRLGARTTLSVEARRLIFGAGTGNGTPTRTATVNVRIPEGQPTGQGGTGTDGLTLTFGGAAPRLSALTVTPATRPLAVYLAGDSTVCDQFLAPWTGWGQTVTSRIRAGAVVANYSDSGESSGSFLANPQLFPAMRPLLQPGDLVLIQFGHNDKATTAADYRANLTSLVSQVRARGAVPVLVTPPVRRLFDGAALTATALHVNSLGVDLPAEMRAVATAEAVPLIDLTTKSEDLLESLGPADSGRLYLTAETDGVTDNTHFSEYGAAMMADLVLQGVREQRLSLARHLR